MYFIPMRPNKIWTKGTERNFETCCPFKFFSAIFVSRVFDLVTKRRKKEAKNPFYSSAAPSSFFREKKSSKDFFHEKMDRKITGPNSQPVPRRNRQTPEPTHENWAATKNWEQIWLLINFT
jgi:hypothetical protein